MKCGNLAASLRKKTGVLFATTSQLPSSVLNLTEKPLGSLAQSCEPDSPPTVEKRVVMGHFLPFSEKISIMVSSGIGFVHSKKP